MPSACSAGGGSGAHLGAEDLIDVGSALGIGLVLGGVLATVAASRGRLRSSGEVCDPYLGGAAGAKVARGGPVAARASSDEARPLRWWPAQGGGVGVACEAVQGHAAGHLRAVGPARSAAVRGASGSVDVDEDWERLHLMHILAALGN